MILTLALLTQVAAVTPPADGAAATPAKTKLICRSYDVTGSLVRKQRVCRTASQWAKVEEDMRAESERLRPGITTERGN